MGLSSSKEQPIVEKLTKKQLNNLINGYILINSKHLQNVPTVINNYITMLLKLRISCSNSSSFDPNKRWNPAMCSNKHMVYIFGGHYLNETKKLHCLNDLIFINCACMFI